MRIKMSNKKINDCPHIDTKTTFLSKMFLLVAKWYRTLSEFLEDHPFWIGGLIGILLVLLLSPILTRLIWQLL